MLPDADPIRHLAIDDSHLVRPRRFPMCQFQQRLRALRPVRLQRPLLVIVRYLLARSLEQLIVYNGRQCPRWAAGLGRLMRGKFKADQGAARS